MNTLESTTAIQSFKTFKQFFFESIDFNKLPEQKPYGFWISAIEVIPIFSNNSIKDDHIIAANRYLGKNRDSNQGSLYTQMYNKGFVRVVVDRGQDILYIQSSKLRPNITARKNARDVALYYGLTPVLEYDRLFESVQEDLPENAPYGFWIKYNEIIPVRGGPGAHWSTGRSYLLKKDIDTDFVHEQMFKLGFVRCVFEVLNIDAGMDIEFKPGTTPRESIKKAETVAEYYNTIPYVFAVKD